MFNSINSVRYFINFVDTNDKSRAIDINSVPLVNP